MTEKHNADADSPGRLHRGLQYLPLQRSIAGRRVGDPHLAKTDGVFISVTADLAAKDHGLLTLGPGHCRFVEGIARRGP